MRDLARLRSTKDRRHDFHAFRPREVFAVLSLAILRR